MSTLKSVVMLCIFLVCSGTRADPPGPPSTLDTVRAQAAKILKVDPGKIDVSKPLNAAGADELDVVEIVLAVEQALGVTIPDRELGERPSQTLTLKQLSEIAAKYARAK